jgi:hypothetical protein
MEEEKGTSEAVAFASRTFHVNCHSSFSLSIYFH